MQIRQLQVLQAIIKTGSVSDAARFLNVSQPAVSRTLKLLEEELGLLLFERRKGRLKSTRDTELLAPNLELVFSAIALLERRASQLSEGVKGEVSLTCPGNLGQSIVAEAIARFASKFPEVGVSLHCSQTERVVDKVLSNHVDFGIVDLFQYGVGFENIALCNTEVCCVLSHDHPLAQKEALGPKDLEGERLIAFGTDTMIGRSLRLAFESEGRAFGPVMEVNHTSTMFSLAERGVGVALLDPFCWSPSQKKSIKLRPFVPRIEIQPTAVVSTDKVMSTAADTLLNEIKLVSTGYLRDLHK